MPNPTPEQVDEVLERDARMRAALGDDLPNHLALHDRAILADEVKKLRAEVTKWRDLAVQAGESRAEEIVRATNAEAERDEARTALAAADKLAAGLRGELAAARAEVEQWRTTFGETALRDGLARMARIEAERDEARAELAGYQRLSTSPTRDDLTGLETLCAFLHASGEADPNVIKDVAWRTFALIRAYREREAERDEAREQVKRVADEAEARAAKQAFNDPYEYGQAIGLRAVAAGLREVLDRTEDGSC